MKNRKTFAIISHPDAGKTTMTEHLLLMGGAIHMAGFVKAKKNKKFTTSDWMELEKQRGISVSTSVMNFEYQGILCNLLDTPGHQDFSEDTLRTLSAVDSAIMLLDAAKGVEAQTLRLFEVCKSQKIPIFTFINKMDRDALPLLDLMDNIEKNLGLKTYPMVWPCGSGPYFKGVYHRENQHFTPFQNRIMEANEEQDLKDDLEMLDLAGESFSLEEYRAGNLTPVFFGSAAYDFGLDLFLETFLKLAPSPGPKDSSLGLIQPESSDFSGFVFKIQANMDPKHRDRLAFFRVVSGVYNPGMMVYHSRLKKEIKLAPPQQFFAQEKVQLPSAYPGDIVGIYDPGHFAIGDTLSSHSQLKFKGIPFFAPEYFATLKIESALKRKQMMKGIQELSQEGTIQWFQSLERSEPILAAVGKLQFDVLLFRLEHEYGVKCQLENLPFEMARWIDPDQIEEPIEDILSLKDHPGATLATDASRNNLILFKNDFYFQYFKRHFPEIPLHLQSMG